MASLRDKLEHALHEARLLVLVSQVVLGFQFRAVFEPRFEQFPAAAQRLELGALSAMLFGITLLILPTAFHRIVERGEDTLRLRHFVSRTMLPALLPIVFAAGVDLYLATWLVAGQGWALVAGAATTLVALSSLYGLTWIQRQRRWSAIEREKSMSKERPREDTELKVKITHVLMETRVVLPGVQALLGFQFSIMLSEAFGQLNPALQRLHLLALALTTLTMLSLLLPAAYHRIVERGEITERVHAVASRCVVAALLPLAFALCFDLYVVTHKVLKSDAHALAFAGVALVTMLGAWFGYTLYARAAPEA